MPGTGDYCEKKICSKQGDDDDDVNDDATEDETALFEIERSPHVARKLASEQLSTGEMIGALSQYSCTLTDDTYTLYHYSCTLTDYTNTLSQMIGALSPCISIHSKYLK